MWKISLLFIFGAAINLKNAYAATDEEKHAIKKLTMEFAEQCAKELGVEHFVYEEAKKTTEIDPCFAACILSKTGTLKEGVIIVEEIDKKLQQFLHDDDEIEKLKAIAHGCADEANDSAVDDAASDCERAAIFMYCLKDKKAAIALED